MGTISIIETQQQRAIMSLAPPITVVIACYNQAETIFETMVSVIQQTYGQFELIIVDDGSTDNLTTQLGRITDPRISHHKIQHSGASKARNYGARFGRGQYLAFIDADDLWTPNKLLAQYNALEAHPEYGVAYSWVENFKGTTQHSWPCSFSHAHGDAFRDLCFTNILDTCSNPLIRRSHFDQIGGFDDRLYCAEDWDLFLRLAKQTKFYCLKEVQIYYRCDFSKQHRSFVQKEVDARRVINWHVPEIYKPISFANVYKYLIYRQLSGIPKTETGWLALCFLKKAVYRDIRLLVRRVLWKVIAKALIFIVLPRAVALYLIERFNVLNDIKSILYTIESAELYEQKKSSHRPDVQ